MSAKTGEDDARVIGPMILTIRGHRVIVDADLAQIYGVATKTSNRAVKRNAKRFPSDFGFQLTMEEFKSMRCQIGTSKSMRGGRRYRPYAFTEHVVIMAATILNTPRAVQMSVFVVQAFVRMRAMILTQKDLVRKLAELEKKLTARLDIHETAITEVLRQIMLLLTPPSPGPEPPKRKIGFLVEDRRASYRPFKAIQKEDACEKFIWGKSG